MLQKKKLENIYYKYKIDIENVVREINRSHSLNHPSIPITFIKPEFPEEIPEDVRKRAIDDIYKKKKSKNPNREIIILKEHHKVDEDYINTKLNMAQMEGNSKEVEKLLRMRSMFERKEDILTSYFNAYKRGLSELFSIFENFSKEIICKWKNYDITEKKFRGIIDFNREYNKILNYKFENNFKNWSTLVLFYYKRNILIHSDGLIDKDYITNVNKYTTYKIDSKKIGDKIYIGKRDFNVISKIILNFHTFIYNNLTERITLSK